MEEALQELVVKLGKLPPGELHERLRQLVPSLPLRERFELLHRLGVYHHADTVSGAASTLSETSRLRSALPGLVEEHGVVTILDVPCGDFYWMQRVPFAGQYTGADIVPEIVEANERYHGSENRRFVVLDATRDLLPRVDLVLCRDLFVHLSDRDVEAVLRNLVASGSRLLLTNHFRDRVENQDIESGDFRALNLCCSPFHFPPPMTVIVEDSSLADGLFRDRAMALWNLTDVAHAMGRARPSARC